MTTLATEDLKTLDANFALGLAAVREAEAEDPGMIPEMAEYFESRCVKYVNGMKVTDWTLVAEHAAAFSLFGVEED